ncbi:3-hydroxyacyl-ACP dehydratase FabZ [Paracoccus sp. S-4012]|uniref:3-hydroxyacyl-ACP dehydratase FabZ n=1 Tax=Paracoccus sp. S-4012 TaxID=2665648 RepID=UPI0012B03290|nr:3-hydroxyacyl-ACP dehydratase FabZ [Paracoccus sp. S-4012]MRX50840.1 3-hydroxyacyl-ACP dehydratase FabZ [Paracoccus sp. S-4012]
MAETAPTETAPVATEADLALIKRLIPHRYPFLFIDKVIGIVPHERATGIKNVTANEPHFEGHFPARPIMPGVTIVEALAQTSAVLVSLSVDLMDKEALVYFMAIDNCRFRRMVVPGDVLQLDVEVKRGGGKVWKFAGRASVDGQLACEAEFTAMLDVAGDVGRAG